MPFKKGYTPWNKGKGYLQKGEKNPNWKGDKVGYSGIHIWLRKTFTKEKCEDCGSIPPPAKKDFLEWALIKGCKYERKRENFKCVCRSCHLRYDEIINNITKKCQHQNIGRPLEVS